MAIDLSRTCAVPARLMAILVLGVCLAAPVHAAKDEQLTARERAVAIEDIAALFEKIYVVPETGDAVAQDLRMRLRRGDYDQLADSRALADVLSTHIGAICHDTHTKVVYFEDDQMAGKTAAPVDMQRRRAARRAQGEAANFDFAAPRRLAGNIALLKFDSFYEADLVTPLIEKYMSEAASADALIVDLRENGGGAPQIIALIASYLFDDQPVHLYDQTDRREGTSVEAWTNPNVAGRRLGSRKPVFVLTSAQTYSAAENFAYNLQKIGRVHVVGERTRGGARGAFGRPVTSHLVPMIATRRTVNPVTGSDWDRVGVQPDTAVPAADSLETAVKLANAAIARSGTRRSEP